MPILMTNQEYADKIRGLTKELEKLDAPKIFFEFAKGKTTDEMEKFVEEFKENHPSHVWEEMEALFFYYELDQKPEIFHVGENMEEDSEDTVLYNPEEINPASLIILMALSEYRMDDVDLFAETGIEDYPFGNLVKGYVEESIEAWIAENTISSIYKLVKAVNYQKS